MENSGFIIINKPVGPTSHDVVNQMRKITGIKKIGHAGTLDPFASGVLILAIGRDATKQIDKIVQTEKEYLADLCLGATTDTYDRTGKIREEKRVEKIEEEKIQEVLKTFRGEQEQIPPMFSAKKIQGQKLYKLARQGQEIKRDPVKINISEIKLVKYNFPRLKIKVRCSKGTYIRSLAYDIGQALGCGAYLEELQRTAVGDYTLEKSLSLDKINKDNWEKFSFQSVL